MKEIALKEKKKKGKKEKKKPICLSVYSASQASKNGESVEISGFLGTFYIREIDFSHFFSCFRPSKIIAIE